MTQEQINVAIAKSIGYKEVECSVNVWNDVSGKYGPQTRIMYQVPGLEKKCTAAGLHPYCTSLDSMREVLKGLDFFRVINYLAQLQVITGFDKDKNPHALLLATPEQQAEAYLKSLGLWKTQ